MSRIQHNARSSAVHPISSLIRFSAAAGMLALATSAGSAQATGYTIGTAGFPLVCANVERGVVHVVNQCGAAQAGHIHWDTYDTSVQQNFNFPTGNSYYTFNVPNPDDLEGAVVDVTAILPSPDCIWAQYDGNVCIP